MAWAEARFSRRPVRATSCAGFLKEFKRVSNHPEYESNASLKQMSLSQGSCSVSDYLIEFWTVAAKVDWTEDASWAAYTIGLSERIKDDLVSRDDPPDLDSLISLCKRLDDRLFKHYDLGIDPSHHLRSIDCHKIYPQFPFHWRSQCNWGDPV